MVIAVDARDLASREKGTDTGRSSATVTERLVLGRLPGLDTLG